MLQLMSGLLLLIPTLGLASLGFWWLRAPWLQKLMILGFAIWLGFYGYGQFYPKEPLRLRYQAFISALY